VNPLGSSLVCTAANLIPGADDNYLFADGVHPTPYGNRLLADFVSAEMKKLGWM
jgi:outer membrane lipase/esterase